MIYEKPLKTHAQIIIESLRDREYDEKEHIVQVNEQRVISIEENEQQDSFNRYNQNKLNQKAFIEFGESVKKVFLSECIMDIFSKVLQSPVMEGSSLVIAKNLVNKFIEENGVDKLLTSFKRKSILLSEYSRMTDVYYRKAMIRVDKDNKETYNIAPEIKDDFFDELKMADPQYAIDAIRTRVTDGIEEFINGNIANKIDIKDILQTMKDRIDKVETDEIKQEYGLLTKQRINDVKSKSKNIFWTMTQYASETIMKNKDLNEYYSKDGNIDIDKIVEDCKVMYAFLELVNSTKMVDVNEQYLQKTLEDVRG